jgi:hypothetical protein
MIAPVPARTASANGLNALVVSTNVGNCIPKIEFVESNIINVGTHSLSKMLLLIANEMLSAWHM